MNKTIFSLALALVLSVTAGALNAKGLGENAVFANTVEGASIQVFLDGAAIKTVAAANKAAVDKGIKYPPTWGGPNVSLAGELNSGGVTGRDYAVALGVQESAYIASKKVSLESQTKADWELTAGLSMRTWVTATIYNRIARNLRDGAFTQGKLKSRSDERGYVEGTTKIDRKALEDAKVWYQKAEKAGTAATTVVAENQEKTDASKSGGLAASEQATRNILTIDNLLASDDFNADGNHRYVLN